MLPCPWSTGSEFRVLNNAVLMCGTLNFDFEDKIFFFAKNRQKYSFPLRDARDQALEWGKWTIPYR